MIGDGPFEFLDAVDAAAAVVKGVAVNHLAVDHVGEGINLPLVEQFKAGHYSIASL